MAYDTDANNADAIEVIEPDDQPDPLGLGGLLGGLDLGSIAESMGIEMPDPDAATADDILDELAELRACVDWIAHALIATVAGVPAKWRPDVAEYPPPLPE